MTPTPMHRDAIVAGVHDVLATEFEIEASALSAQAHLFEDLDLDSLDAVDLIVALEARFGGRVPEEEAKKVRTVADLYALVEERLLAG